MRVSSPPRRPESNQPSLHETQRGSLASAAEDAPDPFALIRRLSSVVGSLLLWGHTPLLLPRWTAWRSDQRKNLLRAAIAAFHSPNVRCADSAASSIVSRRSPRACRSNRSNCSRSCFRTACHSCAGGWPLRSCSRALRMRSETSPDPRWRDSRIEAIRLLSSKSSGGSADTYRPYRRQTRSGTKIRSTGVQLGTGNGTIVPAIAATVVSTISATTRRDRSSGWRRSNTATIADGTRTMTACVIEAEE